MAAEDIAPEGEIVKRTIRKTYWFCPDGHAHISKKTAQKCLDGRPKREAARIRRQMFDIEREILAAASLEAERIAIERRTAEGKAFKEGWRAAEISRSDLDVRVSQALYAHGVTDRAAFKEKFVTADNALDITKLGGVATLLVDDYPDILRWLNSQ